MKWFIISLESPIMHLDRGSLPGKRPHLSDISSETKTNKSTNTNTPTWHTNAAAAWRTPQTGSTVMWPNRMEVSKSSLQEVVCVLVFCTSTGNWILQDGSKRTTTSRSDPDAQNKSDVTDVALFCLQRSKTTKWSLCWVWNVSVIQLNAQEKPSLAFRAALRFTVAPPQ